MAVASREGGYRCSDCSVRPVNGGRNLFCNAVCLQSGECWENNAAWANATRSAGVFVTGLIAGKAWSLWASAVSSSCLGGSQFISSIGIDSAGVLAGSAIGGVVAVFVCAW
jgi:hypothetical protein